MSIYTKKGDGGKTSLANGIRISKSDDRIELLGTIDELNSAIGLAKVLTDEPQKEMLSRIQRELMQIMAGIPQIKLLTTLLTASIVFSISTVPL